MAIVLRPRLRMAFSLVIAVFIFSTVSAAKAGTIVRVSTSMGDYSIEMLDDITPITVQNFLNYVNRNDYNGTYLGRVLDDFVVQGGGYSFQLYVGPITVVSDPPIVNEFNVSNTRGTVAMAKFSGDPDSAANEWFVNLADNSLSLDASNGGFTVFGNVLGNGMAVLDAIDALPFVELGLLAPIAPYITDTYNNPLDLVYINVEVVSRYSEAPNVFEASSGLLITSVSINDGASLLSLNFNLVPSTSGVTIQANPESLIKLHSGMDGIATYSTVDNRLRIPSLEVNQNGSVILASNVVFVLSNLRLGQFTLESFDQ